jgi:hypothetical protein
MKKRYLKFDITDEDRRLLRRAAAELDLTHKELMHLLISLLSDDIFVRSLVGNVGNVAKPKSTTAK